MKHRNHALARTRVLVGLLGVLLAGAGSIALANLQRG